MLVDLTSEKFNSYIIMKNASVYLKLLFPKVILSSLLCLCFSLSIYGQHDHRNCGMDHHVEQLSQNPNYEKTQAQKVRNLQEYLKNVQGERALCDDPVILPMAVHYQGISNPDAACLIQLAQAQIAILNDDYHGTNADISNWNANSGAYPGASNGETCITFCLATQNHPTGYNLNNGDFAVTINQTGSTDFIGAWSGYINIYVRSIGALGYSPFGGNGNGDGVTVDISAFGAGAGCNGVVPGAPYNLGRTLTHELGHYLLLDHIWGGGCGVDDGIADTPSQSAPYGGCPNVGASSCGTTDMHMNYMDYVNDQCMYMFSANQSTVMEGYVASNLQNVVTKGMSVCVAVCPNTLVVTDMPIPSNTYQAQVSVTSASQVAAGANVIFNAGEQICLDPNFEVPMNTDFEANITPCN